MTDDLLKLPAPLAANARPGRPADGPCAACGHGVGYGDRIADLPDGRTVHVACVALAAAPGRPS